MSDVGVRNAVIGKAKITNDDHGLLTAYVDLDYGGSGQCFGGHCLYLPKSFKHHELQSFAGHFIWRMMEIAGVSNWDELTGKTIRVKSSFSSVEAVGHIVKDGWFNPSEDFKA